jgi:hypothetical protein
MAKVLALSLSSFASGDLPVRRPSSTDQTLASPFQPSRFLPLKSSTKSSSAWSGAAAISMAMQRRERIMASSFECLVVDFVVSD